MPGGFSMDQAVAEAARCLLCHDAPCSKGCPADTKPAEFIRKLHLRNVSGAIRTIKHQNILGGACGLLCPTARLCEKECSATGIDRPIRIGQIQRFLVQHSWDIGFRAFDKKVFTREAPKKEKIAVIGSGPSGLSCAAELAKAGYPVTVFEARQRAGGVLRYGVPSFRFADAFLDQELKDLESLGVTIRCSTPISGKGAAEKLLSQGFKAVFIGCGLWEPVRMGPGGKSGHGVFHSVEFLEAMRQKRMKPMEKFMTGKTVTVIGGGSVAMDCARSALRLQAKDVYLIYRRSFSQMPAENDELIETLEEGVHFLLLNQPVGYLFDKKGLLTGIRVQRTKLGKEDASGRRAPEPIPDSDWVLETDALIEAIGNQAPPDQHALYPSLKTDKNGLIQVHEKTFKTSKEGIFAGGDVVHGPALVVEAVRDGKNAAKAILSFLAKGGRK